MHRALIFILLPAPLCAQSTWSGGLHVGQAVVDANTFRTAGISAVWAFQPQHTFRFKVDRGWKHEGAEYFWRRKDTYDAWAADWIWHRHGFKDGGLFLGAGLGQQRVRWEQADVYTGTDWRRKSSLSDTPHFVLGGSIGPHVWVEARFELMGGGDSDAPMIQGSLGWIF